MAGQTVQRDERTFTVRVFVDRDANGKRKYKNRNVRGARKGVQALLNKLLRDYDLGLLIDTPCLSLDAYLDHWPETAVKPRVRERTHKE